MSTATLTSSPASAGVDVAQGGVWQLGGTGTRARLDASVLGGYALRASFADVAGRLVFGQDGTPASVEVRIDVTSLDTGDARRDRHLRSAAFLDVETYPAVCFQSRWFEPAGVGRWRVHGDLRIRDVARPVVFDVVHDRDECRATVRVHGQVDRRDFGLVFNRVMERTFRVGTDLIVQAEVAALGCGDRPVASPCDDAVPAPAAPPTLAA